MKTKYLYLKLGYLYLYLYLRVEYLYLYLYLRFEYLYEGRSISSRTVPVSYTHLTLPTNREV